VTHAVSKAMAGGIKFARNRPLSLLLLLSTRVCAAELLSPARVTFVRRALWRLPHTAQRSGSVDVSDLGLTLSDLDTPIPAGPDGPSVVLTRGVESSSGLADKQDEGISWQESRDTVEATLIIPGLRGQPAAAMLMELTETTATVTVFGRTIWSCILRGQIDPRASTSAIRLDGLQPVIEVALAKARRDPRWNGFVASIGVDSVLQ